MSCTYVLPTFTFHTIQLMIKNILLIPSFLIAIVSNAQNLSRPDGKTINAKEADKIITSLMEKGEVTGLQLGIINNDKPAYVKSYGYKNKTAGQLNDTATCFYAASLAKPLFAYLVMQLVDSGLLDLDKPLYTYLPHPIPDYEMYTDLKNDERWKLITARHCLDHSTGFPNWRQFNPHGNGKLEIFFTPGARYAYSGEGLFLLQMVIEIITGRSLETLAQEKIFQPFGMRRSSFLWQPAFEKNYAVGHDTNEDTIPKAKATNENAAGSMETTIADYTRFISAVLQSKRITPASAKDMFTPQIAIHSKRQFPSLDTSTTNENDAISLSYGLGWGLFNSSHGKAFFKEGHGDGWTHYMIGFPATKQAFIIMTNSSNGESIFKELVEKLTGVTIPWYWEGYTPYRPTVRLSEAELKPFTGTYDGKLKVKVELVNGKLKASSATNGLPPTNIYPVSANNFFLKIIESEIEFVKDAGGKVIKAVLDDEGEHYELIKTE